MSRFKKVWTTKTVFTASVIVIGGTLIWFAGWMVYDVLIELPGAWKWEWLKPSFYQNLLFAILTIYVSCLVFWYRRRIGIYEKLQKLVRQYINDIITEEVFEKRLKRLEERSDVDTRARIKEYLPHVMAFERAIAFVDKQKTKKK